MCEVSVQDPKDGGIPLGTEHRLRLPNSGLKDPSTGH